MASRRLLACGEAQVVGLVARVPIAATDLEPGEALSGHDVGHARHRLGAIGGRGPVAQYLNPVDHQHRQRVDVEEALPGVIGDRREPGPAAVDQGQGGREPDAAQAELRDALQIGLLGGQVGAGVGGEAGENVHRLGGTGRLECRPVERLHRRAAFVHRRPADQGADHHDLLDHRIVDRGGAGLICKCGQRTGQRGKYPSNCEDWPGEGGGQTHRPALMTLVRDSDSQRPKQEPRRQTEHGFESTAGHGQVPQNRCGRTDRVMGWVA